MQMVESQLHCSNESLCYIQFVDIRYCWKHSFKKFLVPHLNARSVLCMQAMSFYGWSSENMWHFSWDWADHFIKFRSWYSYTACLYSTDVWVCRLKTVDYPRYIRYRRRLGIWICFPFQGFFFFVVPTLWRCRLILCQRFDSAALQNED
jgi:hypothetical protein